MKRKNGLTFIELLVTIAIIGVLAAILLPALKRAQQIYKDTQEARAMCAKEFATATTLNELSKKPPTFWEFKYAFGEFVPAGKVVELKVYKDKVYKGELPLMNVWLGLDQESYDFVAAHKNLTLAEVVSLWRAEQDAKSK